MTQFGFRMGVIYPAIVLISMNMTLQLEKEKCSGGCKFVHWT